MIDIKKLKALAKAATPGEWHHSNWGDGDIEIGATSNERSWQPILFKATSHGTEADAAFVAAANPQTVLALIAIVEEAREGIQHTIDCYLDVGETEDAAAMHGYLERIDAILAGTDTTGGE